VVPAVTLPAHVGPKRKLYEHLRRRYAGEFSEHVVDRYCVAGTPEECAARVREYVEAGARHVVFNVAAPEDAERLAEVVLAAAR
jgi:alkanesulfonate monooxygenase SsuD/methylene tetrahydromethanopterin reductase-like flavin-dependent oxidoreductase (luciferase family)